MYFTFISCALSMGTWECGNFLVKTTTDDKPLGNFIDCERGKSKEHKCEGIIWEEVFLLQ